MSTQTGIQANDELRAFFGKCREGKARDKYRLVKVIIVNEELTLEEAKETKGSWKEDWDGFVLRAIDDNEPCYILYRLVGYFHLNLADGRFHCSTVLNVSRFLLDFLKSSSDFRR